MTKKRPVTCVIVFCGPSGAGKDSCICLLRKIVPGAVRLVKAATRSKRPEERNGVHYYFMSLSEFQHSQGCGMILSARRSDFDGTWYGIDVKQFESGRLPACLGSTCHSVVEFHEDVCALRMLGDLRSVFVHVRCPESIRMSRAHSSSRRNLLQKRMAKDRTLVDASDAPSRVLSGYEIYNGGSLGESRDQLAHILLKEGMLCGRNVDASSEMGI